MNLIQRIAGAALGVVLFVLALVFASVLLAVAGGIALGVWAWLAWKTRGTRKAMDKDSPSVIEGEYRVETEIRRLDEPPR